MTKKQVGLKPDEVRKLLMEEHDISLDERDPILIVTIMLNCFVNEYNNLLERHHDAMKKTMKGALGDFSKEMKEVSDRLMDKAVRTTIENTVTEIGLHKAAMDSFLGDLKKQMWISIACAVVCLVAAFVALVFWGLS